MNAWQCRHLAALVMFPLWAATPEQAASIHAILPFPAGTSSLLLQGNNGPWGHSGHAAYSFDFKMPIGSSVVAARVGTVVAVEERYSDGNRKPGEENFVIIRHPDGTFSRYYHLTKDGSLVAVGAEVKEGQPIARSGDTGASAGPHLHFDATRGCYEWGCQTVPITFDNVDAPVLAQGSSYTALPISGGK